MMEQKKLYTVAEVAEILAVGRNTVHRLIKSGELSAMKIRSTYRISEDDLQKYIRYAAVRKPEAV